MRDRRVILLESAEQDLDDIADWIADFASTKNVTVYMERIKRRIDSLSYASERGTLRAEVPNLRIIGLLKSVSAAFVVDGDTVVVHRVLYRGRNLDRVQDSDDD